MLILLAVENRVRPLVLVIKKWASHHDINDASRGTLSSYSLVLMVLHYLQSKYYGSFSLFKTEIQIKLFCSSPVCIVLKSFLSKAYTTFLSCFVALN